MRRILLVLSMAALMAAMLAAMAAPAMAFNSSQHCAELNPESPCPFPDDEGAPIFTGGPGGSHREGTRGNLENVKASPSSIVLHCRELGGKGSVGFHFNPNAPEITGGGDCEEVLTGGGLG
jgi:hypothetical protein